MASAFAALTSLKHILHNLQNHPSPPISIDKRQVQSLIVIVTFLQEFLQGYHSHPAYTGEADPLETRITRAAYMAEDLIESEIVDRIRIRSTIIGKIIGIFRFSRRLCRCRCLGDDLYQDLQLLIEEMDLIRKAARTIHMESTAVRPQLRRHVSTAVGPFMSSSSTPSSMVGFDDVFLEVLECLMGGQFNLQIIPITGMGGIGKTTLARNLFENAYVKEHFYICTWTTISQDFNEPEVLKELLNHSKGDSSGESEYELGNELYKYLGGRRYLIVMDDVWSIETWNKIRLYLPDNKNGSRIIVTTRLSNLASHFSRAFEMKFLDEVSSWNLFCKTVFGDESFPLELEEVGENIVRNCRGLPLSIVTIGGLLAKSEQTWEYWEHIWGNLNSIVNSEGDEHSLRILKMSYDHLPIHLRPCFLYMGVFEEDCRIRVSELIKLWVSEGFLEPTNSKSLETIGEENLRDLVDRNLVLVDKLGSTGNMKYCKVHDLLRDLCLREVEKERFYCILRRHIPQGINNLRRIVVSQSTSMVKFREALQSMPNARSVISDYHGYFISNPEACNLRLLRILQGEDVPFRKHVFELVNLRCILFVRMYMNHLTTLLDRFWNLQTLIVHCSESFIAPTEIWNMLHLRHVKIRSGMRLPDPPTRNLVILENLQTLKIARHFKLNPEVVKRMPNIKKLAIQYYEVESNGDYYCLNYLDCLHKLESFQCFSHGMEDHDCLKKLTFPRSLKKLKLVFNVDFKLEEMLEKIGSLPFLQSLIISGGFFGTGIWETVEGQFPRLEFLTLRGCGGLKWWMSESSHFPRLKGIHLDGLIEFTEIPFDIGDIPTLQRIDVSGCKMSTVMNLKMMVEEQEELYGESLLRVRVNMEQSAGRRFEDMEVLRRLAGPNFEVA